MTKFIGNLPRAALLALLLSCLAASGAFAASSEAHVADYGALPNDNDDDTTEIQAALNANDVLYFSQGYYKIGSTITIPQTRNLVWHGAGFRSTELRFGANITGLNYARSSGVGGTQMSIYHMRLREDNQGQTSTAIKFFGYDEDEADNWLRLNECSIYGLDKGVWLKYAGQCHFVGVYAQSNDNVYYLERGASFIWFNRCMNLSNNAFLYANDTTGDGYSNGITISDSASVFSDGIDVRILGWQAIFINQCGFDLGTDGTAAVYLKGCSDFHIDSSWIASEESSAPNRIGIHLQDINQFGTITNCSIVNNDIGIRYDGVAVGSGGLSAKLKIDGNVFEGNDHNDVLILEGRDIKVVNNGFYSNVSSSGTDYSVYGNTTGTNYCFVRDNTFSEASYTISIGANSSVGDNLFSVPY